MAGKDNIFGEVGKRTPYEVPEGFFQDMEERIKGATVGRQTQRSHTRAGWRAAAAAAAALAVGLIGFALLDRTHEGDRLAMADSLSQMNLVQAEAQEWEEDDEVGDEQYLSDEELEARIAFYDCDVFMDYDY